ncbi:MAG: hypothetical protein ACXADB_04465 [Candidatus Hermodarchaeia archaeon]|jgi:hypothetical protein
MKQVIAQEKAWEMIRGAKSAGGQIVSASIHVRITESTNASDFQKTVSAILDDGFTQPRGRAVIVWGEQAADISDVANLWLHYGTVESSDILSTCRNLAGKAGFGETGRLRLTCVLEFSERNRMVTLHDLAYPARGGEAVADTVALRPYKAISEKGEYTFRTVPELKEFLSKVKDAETHKFDDKTGKWVRWVEVEQTEDKLLVSIPSQKGSRKLQIDLQTGKVEEEK